MGTARAAARRGRPERRRRWQGRGAVRQRGVRGTGDGAEEVDSGGATYAMPGDGGGSAEAAAGPGQRARR